MWGKDDATMVGTMRHMWRMGGLKPFFAAYRVAGVREGSAASLLLLLLMRRSAVNSTISRFRQHLRKLAPVLPVRSSAPSHPYQLRKALNNMA
jgi:hypothetical protein